jgi:hypothetical protein
MTAHRGYEHHQLHVALAAGDEPLARDLLARGASGHAGRLRAHFGHRCA